MSRKRQTSKERLRLQIERARSPHVRTLLQNYREPDWNNQRFREITANMALTLSDKTGDRSLRKAFKEFGLDPINPLDWRSLLDHLAQIQFPTPAPRGPRGARPKWDEHSRLLFVTDVARTRKRLNDAAKQTGLPKPTDDDVAAFIREIFPGRYASRDVASLRKYIVSGPPKGRR
jgi:hypothetical protein